MRLDISGEIDRLKNLEEKALFNTLAMMAYNPSIGRALSKDGVNKFISIANEMSCKIEDIQTIDRFDLWHNQFVEKILAAIKTTSRGETISYGQAQKPINVFLKVYVDWAGKPKTEVAIRLRPYLHVPLDSKVMEYTRKNFSGHCQKYKLEVMLLSEIVMKKTYYSWQRCFRELSPEKPLTIDAAWAEARFSFR